MRTISTVIIKPTKGCNADCSYCSAPPDGAGKWTIETFSKMFDNLEKRLHPHATFIWHGGEPMLLGPDFYIQAYDIVSQKLPHVKFSMQSNILGYNDRWKMVFRDIFNGSISTSWDPDEQNRTVKGSTELYKKIYVKKMDKLLSDGFRPKVISTYDEPAAKFMHKAYDEALESSQKGMPYDIRLNYRYPAGRAFGEGETLSPATYGSYLVEIYDRWISDNPNFTVTPLDQMLSKVIGAESGRCPWAKGCAGKIIGVEPNFDVYNCGEFADLGKEEYRFGNLMQDDIHDIMASQAIKKLAKRPVMLPESCKGCVHFQECEGGCMRDSELYNHGLYGKFHYCESWQEVFSRIKESILTGEADGILKKMGREPTLIKSKISSSLEISLHEQKLNMRRPVLSLGYIPSNPQADFEVTY